MLTRCRCWRRGDGARSAALKGLAAQIEEARHRLAEKTAASKAAKANVANLTREVEQVEAQLAVRWCLVGEVLLS